MDSIGQTISLLSRSLQTELIEAGTLKDMHKVIVSATALSAQLQSVAAEQNKNISATLESFRGTASHFDSIMGKAAGVVDSAKIAATLANVKTTSDNLARISSQLDSSTTQLRVFVDKMENGNGTVQKLMTRFALYTDARHLLADDRLARRRLQEESQEVHQPEDLLVSLPATAPPPAMTRSRRAAFGPPSCSTPECRAG